MNRVSWGHDNVFLGAAGPLLAFKILFFLAVVRGPGDPLFAAEEQLQEARESDRPRRGSVHCIVELGVPLGPKSTGGWHHLYFLVSPLLVESEFFVALLAARDTMLLWTL